LTKFLYFFLFILFFIACSVDEQKSEQLKSVPIEFPFPLATEWTGIPYKAKSRQFKSQQKISYVDQIITSEINYCYPLHCTTEDIKNKLSFFQTQDEEEEYTEYHQPQKRNSYNHYHTGSKPIGVPKQKDAREKVKFLNLSNKNLTAVPYDLMVYKNLYDLKLSDNKISRLGLPLFYCQSLKKLDLSSNLIVELPLEIVYLGQLEELYLRDNKLEYLPGNFNQLRNLKILDLSNHHSRLSISYNDLQFVPPTVCQLTQLERLFLEKLPLEYIPVHLTQLKNLKLLSLSGCRKLNMYNTVRILSQMEDLQILDISFTGLYQFPEDIKKFKNLKVLIWQEENFRNKYEIEKLKSENPHLKIYAGDETRPFLRGNSIQTILNGY
jgi:hypothetical protein